MEYNPQHTKHRDPPHGAFFVEKIMRNIMFFQDIVKGQYGRKIAYTDVERITEDNVVRVVGDNIGVFNFNRRAIEYLWNYKNGDQPALYRTKTIRDDIVNHVIENHAWEVVRFKMSQTFGEPMRYNSLSKDEKINEAVDRFNNYTRAAGKPAKDLSMGEWQSAVGVGFEAIQLREQGAENPFRIVVPSPLDTFVVYSRNTQEPVLSVQQLKDENGNLYYQCFSKTHEFRIQNSTLMPFLSVGVDNVAVAYSRLHTFGEIPIVEYPNNQDRMSDIELVITMLDSINNMQSNRMDSVEQFVQSWIKFVNCEIDKTQFEEMKKAGALAVKTVNKDFKADVDLLTQELNQTQTQVAKDDLWDNVLNILAIPNKQSNTGGDTQGAVMLRNGWDFAKSAAKVKDAYVVESEYRLSTCMRNAIRIRKGEAELPISIADYEPIINHSPTDNMQVKAQSFQMLVSAGINPLIAIKTVGLWNDAEKVYLLSKPYLDVLYKTIDDIVDEEGLQEQVVRAQQLLAENNGNTQTRQTEQSVDPV